VVAFLSYVVIGGLAVLLLGFIEPLVGGWERLRNRRRGVS
jgi:hypothetical protein